FCHLTSPSHHTPLFFFDCSGAPRDLHSFPTRRSSDLLVLGAYPRKRAGDRRYLDQLDVVYDLFPRLKERAGQAAGTLSGGERQRSEEHTSELQSRENLVCRLLLEKKKKTKRQWCVQTE